MTTATTMESLLTANIEATQQIYNSNFESQSIPVAADVKDALNRSRLSTLPTTTATPTLSAPSAPEPSSTAQQSSLQSYIPAAPIQQESQTALVRIKDTRKIPTPTWHAPWKLSRVISGHLGPVRCVAMDPTNEWFVTGGGDRMIKVWDIASGTLKLTLTGHVSTVRGVAVSDRHPYLFSCGEDKMVKCWDLEQNKVIRNYHGHLSGVYSMALHPTLDLLVTTGRDATARVWDMRTRSQVMSLNGHEHTVFNVKCQEADPQVITTSADGTVRLWDLTAGKCMSTLTHHKKGVRALAISPNDFTFVSGSPDNIKQWQCPQGKFIQNFAGQNTIINTLGINNDGVMFSGGDNGTMFFWDYKTGYNFQTAETLAQSGSLDSEAGIYCSTFDGTGLRLITGEADKSIKIWKEDENATKETHPINWRPNFDSIVR